MSGPSTAIQFSFATGELAPGVRNRRDWERRDGGVASLLNGIVGPTGGASKRPGFRMHAECLHNDKPIRLVKFEFSEDQTYQLEFGENIMRVHTNEGVITNDNNTDYVIASPFTAAQAQKFRFTQNKDLMIFTHQDVPTQQLVRFGHRDWRWSQLFRDVSRIASPTNLAFYDAYSNGHNNFEYAVTAYRTISGSRQESINYPSIKSLDTDAKQIGSYPQNNILSCINWIETFRGQYGGLPGYPSYPAAMNLSDIIIDAMDWAGNGPNAGTINPRIKYIFNLQYPAYPNFLRILSSSPYYSGDGWGVFGNDWRYADLVYYDAWYPNQHSGRDTWYMRDMAIGFIDAGLAVDGYTKAGIYNSIMSFISNYNNANGIKINNRVKWAGTTGAEGYFVYRRQIGSSDPNFYLVGDVQGLDFIDANVTETPVYPQTPITGINQFTSPDNYPAVCAFFQQRLILGNTRSKPCSIFGSRSGIYTDFSVNPSDPAAGWEFEMSSKQMNAIKDIMDLKPFSLLTSGGDFVSTVSGAVTASNVNFDQHSYNGTSDVPAVIIGDSAVYIPLSKQTILSMVYSFEKDGFARDNILIYAQHLTEGKTVTGLAFLRDPINLVFATLSDGTFLSCTYIPSQQFQAWTHHKTQGEVLSINSMQTSQGFDRLWAVVRRTLGDGRSVQYIEYMEDTRPYGGEPTRENSFFVDCGLSAIFDQPYSTVYGLEHLEGLQVSVLADNSVAAGFDNKGMPTLKTVVNGAIALDTPATVVHVGLPYEAELETLDLELFNQGTLRNADRQIWQVVVELDRCRELWYSTNDSKYYEYPIQDGKTIGLEPQPISGDRQLNPLPRNNRHTFCKFKSPNPVPWGIRSVVAEIVNGNP